MPQKIVKIVKEFEVYNYNELSDSAKQVVRGLVYDAIDAGRCETLMGDLVEYCGEKYGIRLDEDSIFYNFSNSQGDGVCFTSKSLLSWSRLTHAEELNVFESKLVKQLSNGDLSILLKYLNEDYTISVYRDNSRYTHAHTCNIDFELYQSDNKLEAELINECVRQICENIVRPTYDEVCKDLEEYGYGLLAIPEEDIETYIDDFDLKFLADGQVFSE